MYYLCLHFKQRAVGWSYDYESRSDESFITLILYELIRKNFASYKFRLEGKFTIVKV